MDGASDPTQNTDLSKGRAKGRNKKPAEQCASGQSKVNNDLFLLPLIIFSELSFWWPVT